jgi:two-component system cell cycle sensor histidine kinase/response regulator CckA
MPAGGSVTISFGERDIAPGENESCHAGKYAVVAVADEGPGIPPEDQPRIFEPFFTTKIYGTGMGLAIVSRIARLHGGDVEFESRPGKGTEFRLYLPEGAPSGEDDRVSVAIDSPMANRTVLLVEDDSGILDLARRLLQAAGLRVLSAETGEGALGLWEIHRDEVDLLFTDIVLPGELSGRDLALKILTEKPSLPVLYTSGYSSAGYDQSYFTKANFLPKPFQPAVLREAVKGALAGL